MAVAFRFSPPPPFRAAPSRANPLLLNILHVSTFTSNILHVVAQTRLNEFKDLARRITGRAAKSIRFANLSSILSIFYPQLLSIQRFCPCSGANLMIPKDHGKRGVYLNAERPRNCASNSFALYILPATPYYPKILLVFFRQLHDSKKITGGRVYTHCPFTDT